MSRDALWQRMQRKLFGGRTAAAAPTLFSGKWHLAQNSWLLGVSQGMIGAGEGRPFGVNRCKDNPVRGLIQGEVIRGEVTGLAGNPQMRTSGGPAFAMNRVTFRAGRPRSGNMWGSGYIPVALDAGNVTVSSLFNGFGFYLQGYFCLIHLPHAFRFAVAFHAQTLTRKGACIGMDIGKPVTIETVPLFAVYGGRHQILLLGQGRGKIRQDENRCKKNQCRVQVSSVSFDSHIPLSV